MKIRFMQSGGFVGISKGCEFDTDSLPEDAAKELKRLVKQSGIQKSGEFLSEKGRDLQQYEIAIEGENAASVTFDDSTIPEPAKPLLGFLKKQARPTPLR